MGLNKFQPATIIPGELHNVGRKELGALREQFAGLETVRSGLVVLRCPGRAHVIGRLNVSCLRSRSLGIQQGSKVHSIDDFSRTSVNSSVQTCESPKTDSVDVFASLCVQLMMNLVTLEDGSAGPLIYLVRTGRAVLRETIFEAVFVRHGTTARQLQSCWVQDACSSFWAAQIHSCFLANIT